jgi:small subunit ribosomal protein S9
MQYYESTGRRKTATARVRVFPGGTGEITVNERAGAEYFPRPGDMDRVLGPIKLAQLEGRVNVSVHVLGGGQTGQADAVANGVARALLKYNPELRGALRTGGFLTRDSREKERKKPGLKKARKRPTFTKR